MSSTEYRANTRDLKFILHEMLEIEDTLLKREAFADFGVDDVNMILDEAAKFSEAVFGPINQQGDREGCRFDKGKVHVPECYHEAYRKYCENGWNAIGIPVDVGGQGAPSVLTTATGEMMTGACTSMGVYTGLTIGAARLIYSFGND